MKIILASLFSIFAISLLGSCASRKISNLEYAKTPAQSNDKAHLLNVFQPRKESKAALPVLIFVHGGNWDSGNKGTYGFFGRHFAKNGLVVVIPNYTLSPVANYDDMTKEIAEVIAWTKSHVASYGGDTNQVFVSGHSAGGHLIALATMNPAYKVPEGSIAGMVFIDAAGLAMDDYLAKNPPTKEDNYLATWSNDPKEWKNAAPINFIDKKTPPILIYLGTKTYPSISSSNEAFIKKMQSVQPRLKANLLKKKHIPMVLQFLNPWNKRIVEITDWMKAKQ